MEIIKGVLDYFFLLMALLAGGFFILGLAITEKNMIVIMQNRGEKNEPMYDLGGIFFGLISLYVAYLILFLLVLSFFYENRISMIEHPSWHIFHLPLWLIILTISFVFLHQRRKLPAKNI
ncbi:MAG: hypothetical protein MUC28_01490 [Planctomycetes bacterium]|jgi:hypothetical protein|nr:hypothetical protein [Planctomycetota bacterium]